MHWAFLATAMLSVAVTAAAQSRESAAKPHEPVATPAAKHSAAPAAVVAAVAPAPAEAHGETPGAKAGAVKVPIVSRITATPKPTAPAEGASAADTEGTSKKPKVLVSGATAFAVAKAGPAPHGVEPAVMPAAHVVDPRAPVKLATVPGRIAAALADLHAESKAGQGDAEVHEGAKPAAAMARPRRGTAPATPRVVLTWPEVRWRVIWHDDVDRVTVSWPE